MFKHYKTIFFAAIFSLVAVTLVISCNNKSDKEKQQTILEGEATVYVDESFQYLMEDQVEVFESQYNAKINLVTKTETEIINLMLTGKTDLAILSRKLSDQEENYFKNKGITPKITHFASDAVVFITGKTAKDTLIDLQQVMDLMQGKPSSISNLVFENPNSGTVSYMHRLAGISEANANLYYLKSDKEVIEFVAKNPQSIGVIGLSPIVQPFPESKDYLESVAVMSVKNVKSAPHSASYYKPSQHNLGEGLYPLKRSIYMLNYQGSAALGMGFASFVAGDIGQRIVLKSELLPVVIPQRNISIRKEIINNK